MAAKRVYKVVFVNQGKVYEVYAKQVNQSSMYAFIEVEDLIFGETSAVVIDPSEERLKSEFQGVTRTYIPMHSVVRIDEVEKEGVAKIIPFEGKGDQVVGFPGVMQPPGGKSGDDS